MSSYSDKLDAMQVLRRPVIEQAAGLIGVRPGAKGLDVGCGNGLQTLLFAEMCGPGGLVRGLDPSYELIALARENASKANLDQNTEFIIGLAEDMPLESNSLDWAVSIDCIGYGSRDFKRAIAEMARVVRPGGVLALMAWGGQQILGGHALLEAKLNATPGGLSPYTASTGPDSHFLGVSGGLTAAGIVNIQAKALSVTFGAPLNEIERNAVMSLLDMRWPDAEHHLDSEELELFQGLTNPDSPGFLLGRPNYCGMFFYTLFWGLKEE